MDVEVEPSLTVDGVAFDAADAALLRAIDETASLNAAAEALGRSYSRAHKRLERLEAAFGPLVARERGGAGGGGSTLTERGRETLARFDRVQAVLAGAAAAEEVVIPGRVDEREGDLLTVDSEAGDLRALAATDGDDIAAGDRVAVTLTADAVTLHAPDAGPDATETSARNRLRGTVTAVTDADGVATVTVDVGTATPLSVLVTAESRRRLGLDTKQEVVATFKATAARATALGDG
jgi:molybdate transport system regulatory protein